MLASDVGFCDSFVCIIKTMRKGVSKSTMRLYCIFFFFKLHFVTDSGIVVEAFVKLALLLAGKI